MSANLLSQPNKNGRKNDKCHESDIQLVISGCNTAKFLYLIEEIFNEMAFIIQMSVNGTLNTPVSFRRYNRGAVLSVQLMYKGITVIPPISQRVAIMVWSQQVESLADIRTLPAGKFKFQRISQGIDNDV